MHNRIHKVFFTPLFYMYYTLLTPPLESTKKNKQKKQKKKKKKKKRDTPLYTFDQKKNHFALFDTLNIRLCVCVLFSLSSLCLSFFLRVNYIPFIHSQERSAFGCVALERRGIEESDQKKRRGVQEAEENGLGVVLFFVFVLREERKTSYI